jgi:hypothetical protein
MCLAVAQHGHVAQLDPQVEFAQSAFGAFRQRSQALHGAFKLVGCFTERRAIECLIAGLLPITGRHQHAARLLGIGISTARIKARERRGLGT